MTKTSSWTDAYDKAKSFIVVSIYISDGGNTIDGTIIVPKDEILSNTTKYFFTSYALTTNTMYVMQIGCKPTLATPQVYKNNASITIVSTTYYYD